MKAFFLSTILLTAGFAHAMTDTEATERITAQCESVLNNISQAVVETIEDMGAKHSGNFSAGNCRMYGSVVYLNLPRQTTNAFSDGSTQLRLVMDIRNYPDFRYYWGKTPIYDQFQNVIGFDYKFYKYETDFVINVYNAVTERFVAQVPFKF